MGQRLGQRLGLGLGQRVGWRLGQRMGWRLAQSLDRGLRSGAKVEPPSSRGGSSGLG